MVQSANINPQASQELESEEERTFTDYINIFLKRKEIIITFFIISLVLSAIYYYRLPNEYKATSQILIGKEASLATSPETQAAQIGAGMGASSYYSPYNDYLETQFFIIKSKPIIQALIEQLELVKKYDYFAIGDAVDKMQALISLKREEKTQIINLNVTFTDPKLCAQIANTLTDLYIKQSVATKLYFSKEVLQWFPEESEKIKMHTVYGQLQELSKKDVIESLPSVASDPVIRQLKSRKASLEAELESLSTKYKEKHPITLKTKEDLKYVNDRIQVETEKVVDNLRAELAGKLQLSNIRVIEYAEIPTEPIGPNRLKGIIMAGLVGLFMGLGLVYILDYLDNTIRSQEDVEKYIKLPYLGHVPAVKDKSKGEYEKRIIIQADPESSLAEAFKNIRTGIVFSAPPETLKAILVTSTIPSEGKTFVSVNLAATIAMDGNNTLLVDSDMRRPTIHNTFKTDNSTGLSNYLTGSISLDLIINKTFIENLSFVSAGATPPNPSGLLGSFKMEEFIKAAKNRFDRIIIDGPPLIGVSDGIILSKLVDGTLLTIRFGTASMDVIVRAKQCLQEVGTNIVGVILNDVDIEKEAYYSKYYHYYSRYYAKYGNKTSSSSEPTAQV
ncbi:MAG: polysaccharide biosynthesis tyrosine autokinase [Candidatus Omnitrophica bacterium]|nr:polysaccharide biosynthesis tyrosine autokinase [Candidatus Omnitrophota bacterium]